MTRKVPTPLPRNKYIPVLQEIPLEFSRGSVKFIIDSNLQSKKKFLFITYNIYNLY